MKIVDQRIVGATEMFKDFRDREFLSFEIYSNKVIFKFPNQAKTQDFFFDYIQADQKYTNQFKKYSIEYMISIKHYPEESVRWRISFEDFTSKPV